MKPLKALLIGAGSRGAKAYGPYALNNPDKIKFIAVADLIPERRENFRREHGISEEFTFEDHTALLKKNIPADIVFICVQDQQHYQVAQEVLAQNYDMVLEKPICNTLAESEAIVTKAKEMNRKLIICHVLRYTEFFNEIKKIVDSEEIGELVSVSLNENVGYNHAAHSYVRGNWRNESLSSPMILAKSCHDLDILRWLVGSPCKKLSSFGSLKYFKAENAPQGSAARCLGGCAVKESCPYDAEKIYMDMSVTAWPVNVISDDLTKAGREKALKDGPYGRCVFHCDNNVVDHQAVIMEFDNGVTANFSMNAFSGKIYREINIYCTKGQIWGELENFSFYKQTFGREPVIVQMKKPEKAEYGHGGGDIGFMDYVCAKLNGGTGEVPETEAIISHRLCFAAEDSRRAGKVVSFEHEFA